MRCCKCGKFISFNYGTTDVDGEYCEDCWNKILYDPDDRMTDGDYFVQFPKLERDWGHRGWWILYELDGKGDVCYVNFKGTKQEADKRLEQARRGR